MLIDAIGIKAKGEERGNAHKHRGHRNECGVSFISAWTKKHLRYARSALRQAISGMPRYCLSFGARSHTDQEIATVTANAAYGVRRCHNVIANQGTTSMVPPNKNAQLWRPTTGGHNRAKRSHERVQISLSHLVAKTNRLSPPQPRIDEDELCKTPRPWPHAMDFDRQVAELQGWITVLHRHTALGIPITESEG